MDEPGPLIGTGRRRRLRPRQRSGAASLRTAPSAGTTEREAVVMQHVRAHGYPVPEVFDAAGTDLVMERLQGTTMLDDLGARPWRMQRHCDMWIDLHRRLRALPVGDLGGRGFPTLRSTARRAASRLPPGQHHADGGRPDGLRLAERRARPAGADVAMAWLIVATSTIEESWWLRHRRRAAPPVRRPLREWLRSSRCAGPARRRRRPAPHRSQRPTRGSRQDPLPRGQGLTIRVFASIRVLELDFPGV